MSKEQGYPLRDHGAWAISINRGPSLQIEVKDDFNGKAILMNS